jgi:hypothetical protein
MSEDDGKTQAGRDTLNYFERHPVNRVLEHIRSELYLLARYGECDEYYTGEAADITYFAQVCDRLDELAKEIGERLRVESADD